MYYNGATIGDVDVLPRLAYESGTTSQSNNTGIDATGVTVLGTANQMGPIWGLAWAKSTGTVYASAFYKMGGEWPSRTAGNPDDLGKIYKITNADGTSPSAPSVLTTLSAGLVPYGQISGGTPWPE